MSKYYILLEECASSKNIKTQPSLAQGLLGMILVLFLFHNIFVQHCTIIWRYCYRLLHLRLRYFMLICIQSLSLGLQRFAVVLVGKRNMIGLELDSCG